MQFAKHIHVLHLLSTIPTPEWGKDANGNRQCSNISYEEGTMYMDEITSYMLANWTAPPSTSGFYNPEQSTAHIALVKDCDTLLKMCSEDFCKQLKALPPQISETLFPVAVWRYLTREIMLPINHRTSTTFVEFNNRYKPIVVSP